MDTSGAKIWLSGISDTLSAVSPLCGIIPMKETQHRLGDATTTLAPDTPLRADHPRRQPLPLRLCVATEGGARPLAAGGAESGT